MNSVIKLIQSEIKKLAAHSGEIVTRIHALKKARGAESGPESAALWNEKRGLGDSTRHFLLAYAYLRERRYQSQEPKCRHAASIQWISSIITEAGVEPPSAEALKAWIDALP